MRGRNAAGGFHGLPKGSYAKLSLREKQGLVRGGEREGPVRCPSCRAQLMPGDLMRHVQTAACPGPPPPEHEQGEPPKHSAWITWRDAMAMGIPRATMNFWVSRRFVRVRGEIQDRQYLLRDVAVRFAATLQRRKFRPLNRKGRNRL